jgi:hypothetical protein
MLLNYRKLMMKNTVHLMKEMLMLQMLLLKILNSNLQVIGESPVKNHLREKVS